MTDYFIPEDTRWIGYKDGWGRNALMVLPAEASRHLHTNERCVILERYRHRTLINMDTSPLVRAFGGLKPCPYCDGRLRPPRLEDHPGVKKWVAAFAAHGLVVDPFVAGAFANRSAWPDKEAFELGLVGELLRLKNIKDGAAETFPLPRTSEQEVAS